MIRCFTEDNLSISNKTPVYTQIFLCMNLIWLPLFQTLLTTQIKLLFMDIQRWWMKILTLMNSELLWFQTELIKFYLLSIKLNLQGNGTQDIRVDCIKQIRGNDSSRNYHTSQDMELWKKLANYVQLLRSL